MTNKVVLWVGGVLAALLIAVLLVVIVLVNTLNAQAEQENFEKCMATYGIVRGEVPPADPAYVDAAVKAATECRR